MNLNSISLPWQAKSTKHPAKGDKEEQREREREPKSKPEVQKPKGGSTKGAKEQIKFQSLHRSQEAHPRRRKGITLFQQIHKKHVQQETRGGVFFFSFCKVFFFGGGGGTQPKAQGMDLEEACSVLGRMVMCGVGDGPKSHHVF